MHSTADELSSKLSQRTCVYRDTKLQAKSFNMVSRAGIHILGRRSAHRASSLQVHLAA
jgi:hypothetical protein